MGAHKIVKKLLNVAAEILIMGLGQRQTWNDFFKFCKIIRDHSNNIWEKGTLEYIRN